MRVRKSFEFAKLGLTTYSGWPAGFDYFPCQRDEFVMAEDGSWIDHIAYCGGKNNTCQTPIVFTVANVSLTSPGVMTHWYVYS